MKNQPDFLESQIIDVDWGIGVKVVKPCNLYNCKIGDHSFIGPFVEIQKGAVVGRNCKVQSHSFICSKPWCCGLESGMGSAGGVWQALGPRM